jgi:hypothetical protein
VLGVDAAGRHGAEDGKHVEADEVVVALSGRVLEDDDLEPTLDGLPDGDGRLRVLVGVDLLLEPREGLLGFAVGRVRLAHA